MSVRTCAHVCVVCMTNRDPVTATGARAGKYNESRICILRAEFHSQLSSVGTSLNLPVVLFHYV